MAKKQKNCKSCGAQLSPSSKHCPNCGAKMKKGGPGVVIAVIVVLVLAIVGIVAVLSGEKEKPAAQATAPTASANTANVSPSAPATSAPSDEPEEVLLFDDDFATAIFERVYEVDGVAGSFYLQIQLTNKADREIWVYLEKFSVNGETVPMVGSAIPTYIQPEKSSRNPFIISYNTLSISSVKEIAELSFDVVIADAESSAELERVPGLTVTF